MPINYHLAKIYKIEPLNPDDEADVYIGSTCEPILARRMAGHRRDYTRWKAGRYGNVTSFMLFGKYGVDNCNIFLIEKFPCENKDELMKREGHYIKTIPCVNKFIAGRTNKECLKYQYTKFKCICKGCYTRQNKSHHIKSKKHINYMTKHDAVIEEVNQVLDSINDFKLI